MRVAIGVVVCCILFLNQHAVAQLEGEGGINYVPNQHGQWSGPFDLDPLMTLNGPTGEIVHAVLIPDGPYEGQLLLWNWPGSMNPDGRTWIWDPTAPDPVNVVELIIPVPPMGEHEIFCAGHSLLPNGDVLVAGGQDLTHLCPQGSPPGGARRFTGPKACTCSSRQLACGRR